MATAAATWTLALLLLLSLSPVDALVVLLFPESLLLSLFALSLPRPS
jgi:hypothetical protein